MGSRSATESALEILAAFARRKGWCQADLAREVGIGVPALRRRILELESAGHLRVDKETSGARVDYRVPRDWALSPLLLAGKDTSRFVRILLRAPPSKLRNALLDRLAAFVSNGHHDGPAGSAVSASAKEAEAMYLDIVADSVDAREPLVLSYASAWRGNEVTNGRVVSVQHVDLTAPIRFVAHCHIDGRLKSFRLDAVLGCARADGATYVSRPSPELEAYLAERIDGYHGEGPAMKHVFFVRAPEATWVAKNLPQGMSGHAAAGGLRVFATTPAIRQVAQFVVKLGEAARAETADLEAAVVAIAEGALRAHARPKTLGRFAASLTEEHGGRNSAEASD